MCEPFCALPIQNTVFLEYQKTYSLFPVLLNHSSPLASIIPTVHLPLASSTHPVATALPLKRPLCTARRFVDQHTEYTRASTKKWVVLPSEG